MTRSFTIYLTQSAHTDIGYTHPQEQISSMYLDHYDRVLELCRLSAETPEEQRFKWTCETAWQVRHYLTHRPEREADFLHYVRNGQIEIIANYLHFSDLIDADAYRASLKWAVEYCRCHDLPLRCAWHCDINGWPWAVADILAESHIPYFGSQIHVDSATDPLGRRGSGHYGWLLDRDKHGQLRPDAPIRIPQAFWWEGPAGGSVLHWLGEHYHLGNDIGLSRPHGFSVDMARRLTISDKTTTDSLYETALREVPRYIAHLQADGYALDRLQIATSGFKIDNSPPDGRWCEIVARWNAEHDDIKLRTSTMSEWFDALQQANEVDFPTRCVAWPDHWAHGLGSATARVAQARRTQRRRPDAKALLNQVQSPVASAAFALAFEQELLALEHTFGAWSTTARPGAALNDFQQIVKELYYHRAELYLDEAIDTALHELPATPEQGHLLYVPASTLPEEQQRVIHFSSSDICPDPTRQMLRDERGSLYPFQEESPNPARFVAVLPQSQAGLSHFALTSTPFSVASQPVHNALTLQTEHWSVSIDTKRGGLLSLHEHATGREWVNPEHQYGFGQLVHETVVHPMKREAVGNIARFIALDSATEELRQSFAAGPIFEHATLQLDAGSSYKQGPVFDEIALNGSGERLGTARILWRAYHALPLVELVIEWNKLWSELPEAAYVAFPFAIESGHLDLETGGGFFRPGSHEAGGQLPGTCSSYYTIQRAARLSTADKRELFWLPLDAPLVMPNEINYNRWETDPWAWNGFLASMPVNHYWHTNFSPSQRGPLRLRYRFLSLHGFSSQEQALQAAQPLDAFGWR